jgi:phosphoglycolate phosphatase-like HAD superfamily hydrolase
MLKGVIFDFDGVIADTLDYHLGKLREFTGTPLTKDEYSDMFNGNFYQGKGIQALSGRSDEYSAFVRDFYRTFPIKDDVKAGLGMIAAKYSLFIVSSGSEENIRLCLEHNGLRPLFKEILGHESHQSKRQKLSYLCSKYSLSGDTCVFVTDTLGDILEANAIGLDTIAYDAGHHDRERLAKGNPSIIVSSFKELAETIDSIAR